MMPFRLLLCASVMLASVLPTGLVPAGGGLAAAEARDQPRDDQPIDLHGIDLAPERWTARDPVRVAVAAGDRAGAVRFTVSPGGAEWQVVDGPLLTVGTRSRFCTDRAFALTVQALATGYEGYALQVRLRQGRSGSSYTRNQAPHAFWESTAELSDAKRWLEWRPLTGTSTCGARCDTLGVELWFRTPKAAAASVSLAGLDLRESFATTHLLRPVPDAQGGIFFADRGALHAEFVAAVEVGACRLIACDETGREVARSDGGPGTAALDLALPGRGFFAITASADYPATAEKAASTIALRSTAAVVGAPLADDLRRASRLGAVRVWGSGELWRKAGANWDWSIGAVDLAGYVREADGTIHPPAGAKPQRLPSDHRTVMTFNGLPRWLHGQTGDGLFPPRDWAELERLTEVFARANPDLEAICPFNEPDAHWRGSAADFVRLHQAISAGIRRGNPQMKIYGPCLYSLRLDDLEAYAARGLLDAFDGLVMHAYVDASAPEGEFITRFQRLGEWLRAKGKGDWPVFITEFGWCSGVGDWQKPIPEADRARYAARSLALLATQPLDAIAYFCFMYCDNLEKPGYSLLFRDHTPTPTFVAFTTTLKWLSWTKRGDGRWFRLSPDLNLALFDDGRQAVAVGWTGSGAGSLRLPAVPTRGEDLMGRPLALPGGDRLAVGPDPVFCALPSDPAFRGMATLPAVRVAPGGTLTAPWPLFAAAPEFTAEGGTVRLAADAKPGEYLLLGKSADGWQALPVTVPAPLTLERLDRTLTADATSLVVTATVSSPVAAPEARLTVALADGTRLVADARLAADTAAPLSVTIPGIRIGQCCRGTITVELRGATPWTITRELDQTVLVAPQVPATAAVDWSAIEAVEFADWAPWPRPLAADDCWAQMRTAVDIRGFHLLVEVTDDLHWQGQTAAGMWQEDSVQVAFDTDADQPWQPNNVGHGFNGHRITEYGIGLPSRGGPPMVWRYRADVPDLAAGCAEPRVVAAVTRAGSTTRYDLLFPWAVLGLSAPPRPGPTLGFALLVNDADHGGDRHGLALFDGINASKDPTRFGRLLVTAPRP